MKHGEKCELFLKRNEVNCCALIDSDEEGSFSWNGCECCQSGLGCTVYECQGLDPVKHEVVLLGDVCSSCLCYFANGDEDEALSDND